MRTPYCERCWYDMAGAVNAAPDQAEHTCPECGRRQRTDAMYEFSSPPPGPGETVLWGAVMIAIGLGMLVLPFGLLIFGAMMSAF